jgi:protein-disulfide isomerase
MSVRQQRGRVANRKRGGGVPRSFYIILAVVAVVGIAALGTIALRARQNTAVSGNAIERPALTAPTGQTPDGYYYKGYPDAPVTVVEYSDFQCPFCGRFANSQALTIDKNYVETGKIKYVFHDYPLQQHPNAIPASQAARCAGDQKAFWPMHDMLFANQAQWEDLGQPQAQFGAYAEQLKLDGAAFNQCLSSGKYAAAIAQAQQEGNQARIPGTPTFIVDGQQLDASQLQGAIDAALAKQN